jgi:hypothetical protein
MLYYIHNLSDNVVIFTTNPYILLSYCLRGWHTTPSWPKVLDDHPQWCAEHSSINSSAPSAPSLFMRIVDAMSTSIAIVSSFTPAGMQVASGMWTRNELDEDDENDENDDEEKEKGEGEMRNTGPVHFLTAVERAWYFERGLERPKDGWTFNYRLEDGVREFEIVPGYEDDVKRDDRYQFLIEVQWTFLQYE